MDYNNLTPLELISVTDRERVHTVLLAWVLGKHSPLPLQKRARLFSELAGIRSISDPIETNTVTEYKNIDLLASISTSTQKHFLAIEAKLKSNEHSAQLKRYSQILDEENIAATKLFLTLDGTAPESDSTWGTYSYLALSSALNRAMEGAPNENPYLRDYLLLIGRLASLVVICENEEASMVYFNPQAPNPKLAPGLREYLQLLGLGTTMQQVWMRRLGGRVLENTGAPLNWRIEVSETHGQALLNICNTVIFPGYVIGIQVQYEAVKLFCAPYPYVVTPGSNKIVGAAEILRGLAHQLGITTRQSVSRGRGFTSVSLGQPPAKRILSVWASDLEGALLRVLSATAPP